MRNSLRSEKGEGRLGFIIAVAVLASAAWIAYVLVPIKVKTYEFYDEMRKEARFGAVRKADDVVHKRLMDKAEQLGIPLEPKNLKVQRRGGEFVITADYSVHVDLAFYSSDWEFNERAAAPIF